ncbi:MAG: glycosyltransferase [Cytophagaceae bacterium]|nr:glycosyltransferase [Gemmatimonadaceae bacterium]
MRFSVVIPTFRRPEALLACVAALRAQDLAGIPFEIVVVDDAGDDSALRELLAQFSDGPPIRYAPVPGRRGPAAARNLGAEIATGEFLAFIDDDCEPDPNWLRAFDRAIRAADADGRVLFGGCVINLDPSNVYATASQNLIDFLYDWYNRDAQRARFFTTNNIAVSRESFLAFGGFDPSFPRAAAEDRDFCDRWREARGRLQSVPDAIVHHVHRLSLPAFVGQHLGYGRGAVYLHEARQRRGAELPRIEPLGFYRKLVLWPFRQDFGWRAPVLGALAVVSQAAYAFGYYTERFRRGKVSRSSVDPRPTRPPRMASRRDTPRVRSSTDR